MCIVRLIPIEPGMRDQLAESAMAFAANYQLELDGELTELVGQVIDQTLRMLARQPRPQPWGGFLAADVTTGRLVGTCGFKQGPTADGEIEIAYFIFPPHEGAGCATAMAASLIEMVRNERAAARVVAHTLPEPNASTRILEKLRFRQTGTAVDPRVGAVWRWEVATQTVE